MPKILEDCVKKVEKQKGADSAWAICIESLRSAGKIKQEDGKWVLTKKGKTSSFIASLDGYIDNNLGNLVESSDCDCEASKKISAEEATERFSDFMLDLVALSQENLPPQLDNKFKALRSTYKEYLPIWRESLDAPHKGLFLCIEDLDSWDSSNDLMPYISRVVSLYGTTIQSGLDLSNAIGKTAQKYISRKARYLKRQ